MRYIFTLSKRNRTTPLLSLAHSYYNYTMDVMALAARP